MSRQEMLPNIWKIESNSIRSNSLNKPKKAERFLQRRIPARGKPVLDAEHQPQELKVNAKLDRKLSRENQLNVCIEIVSFLPPLQIFALIKSTLPTLKKT